MSKAKKITAGIFIFLFILLLTGGSILYLKISDAANKEYSTYDLLLTVKDYKDNNSVQHPAYFKALQIHSIYMEDLKDEKTRELLSELGVKTTDFTKTASMIGYILYPEFGLGKTDLSRVGIYNLENKRLY